MRLILLLFLTVASPARADGTVAFLGLTMLDSSLQTTELGQDPAELNRLDQLEQMVTDRFTQEGFELLDLEPIRADLDRIVNPAKCYGCDTRMAAKIGADFVLVGEVQKVSNLILTINLQLRETSTGNLTKGGVVDIRGNTDASWQRGMRYILNNRIFREDKQ